MLKESGAARSVALNKRAQVRKLKRNGKERDNQSGEPPAPRSRGLPDRAHVRPLIKLTTPKVVAERDTGRIEIGRGNERDI